MEKKSPTPMTPFDEWTVPNELHTLKLLLPYTPAASQQALGILIKVIELQHTIQYFDRQKNLLHGQNVSPGFSSPMEMLEEISPYLPPEQANMLESFRNMMNIMDMVQMMQAFSTDTGNTSADSSNSESENASENSSENSSMHSMGTGGGFDPMQLVMGMLSPEQKDMFEMYQTMFSQPEGPAASEFSSGDNSASNSSNDAFAERNKDADTKQPEIERPDIESQNSESQIDESQKSQIERIDTDYE